MMKASISEGKHDIQWTARNQLNDLDFAHDLALQSHTHVQMQIKTASIAAVSASVGLNIHNGAKSRSSNTTWRTANQSFLMAKLWEMWNPSHTPGKHHRCTRRFRCRRNGEDWQSKNSIPSVDEHMGLKTTFNQY
ncbi:unnamed protein product [Schistosoma spindalis]|nr:unnamed protein product [Schistosoma spindale]